MTWQENLRAFDETKAFPEFLERIPQYVEKAVSELPLKNEEASRDCGENVYQEYGGVYRGHLGRWPYELRQVCLLRRKRGRILRKGAVSRIYVGDIDGERSLAFENQQGVRNSYGQFVHVKQKGREDWPGIKFDIESTPVAGSGFYKFVDGLVGLSKKTDSGVKFKFVNRTKDDRLYVKGGHVYPKFPAGASEEETVEWLEKFYRAGKELWGDSFSVNTNDFGSNPPQVYAKAKFE